MLSIILALILLLIGLYIAAPAIKEELKIINHERQLLEDFKQCLKSRKLSDFIAALEKFERKLPSDFIVHYMKRMSISTLYIFASLVVVLLILKKLIFP
jgi:hypothetical protein